MKGLIIFLIFCFNAFCFINVQGSDSNDVQMHADSEYELKKQEYEKAKLELYRYYYVTKEMIKLWATLFYYWVDNKKLDAAFVCCSQCGYKLPFLSVWSELVVQFKEPLFSELVYRARKAPLSVLRDYMQSVCNQEEIQCYVCLGYKGWML